MICYRDRAFCDAICQTETCDRNFTPAAKEACDKWWEMFCMPERAPPVHFTPHFRRVCGEYRPPVDKFDAKALDAIPKHGMVD